MRILGLGEFLGLTTRPVRWERAFMLAAAFVVVDVVVFGLGYSVSHSDESGFTISLFSFASSWFLVGDVVGDVLRVAVFVAALRLIRWEAWALPVAAVSYAIVAPLIWYLLRLLAGQEPQGIWTGAGLLGSALWTLGFFGTLALFLGKLRRPGPALVLGGAAGMLVGAVAVSFGGALARHAGDWGLTFGFFLRGLPRDVVSGALFGLIAWAGLTAAGSFGEEQPSSFIRRSLFVGTFIAANASALALAVLVELGVAIRFWGQPWGRMGLSEADVRAEWFGVLALLVFMGLVGVLITVVVLRFVHRIWTAVQDGHARMSPGQAVGYQFIPLFNFYWVFQVWAGFASDFNAMARRRGLTLPRLRPGLFAAVIVLGMLSALPYLAVVGVASFALAVALFRRVCDGVNALAAAHPAGGAAAA